VVINTPVPPVIVAVLVTVPVAPEVRFAVPVAAITPVLVTLPLPLPADNAVLVPEVKVWLLLTLPLAPVSLNVIDVPALIGPQSDTVLFAALSVAETKPELF
jgi:hypothetical protein